jgi:hypothetical protein
MEINIRFKVDGIVCTTWEEIQELQRKQQLKYIDRKTYLFFKSVVRNPHFSKFVFSARKELDIPEEGFNKPVDDDLDLTISSRVDNYLEDRLKAYRIHSLLEDTVSDIVLYGLVDSFYLEKIWLVPQTSPLPEYEQPEVKIIIDGYATKNGLHRFIDENWEDIANVLESYKSQVITITPKTLRILELRDQTEGKSMKHREIADVINKEYPDDRSTADEDSVKKNYSQAKKFIKRSFSPVT